MSVDWGKWFRWTADFISKNWRLVAGVALISAATNLAMKPPQVEPPAWDEVTAECSCELLVLTLEMCLDLKADRPKEKRNELDQKQERLDDAHHGDPAADVGEPGLAD